MTVPLDPAGAGAGADPDVDVDVEGADGEEGRDRTGGLRPAWIVPLVALALAGAVAILLLRPDATEAVAVERPELTPAAVGEDASLYATFTSGGAHDRLVAVTVEGAATASLHRTTIDPDGRALMTQVDAIELPAGEEVVLVPGGAHVMAEDLTRPLAAGDVVSVALTFEHTGTVQLEVPVVEPSELSSLGAVGGP